MNNEVKSKKLPFFSVVIPVYNKEPHIARSIGSVLNQTYENYELIIVCDPSTDNSNEEVEKFKDSRIKVYHRDSPGPGGYAARNLGIKKANSDWIAFLDADDEWKPDHLEKNYLTICKFEGCSIVTSKWLITQNNRYKLNPYSQNPLKKESHRISLKEFLIAETSLGRPIWTSVACIKREILYQNLFPEGKITMGGDIDTWLKCVVSSNELIWSDHIGAIYHTDSVNMVTKTSIINPELHTNTLEMLLRNGFDDDVNRLLKIRYNNILTYAWNQNMHMPINKNFDLKGKLYITPQPIKSIFYSTFSILPMNVLKPIHKSIYELILFKRKVLS